MFTKRAVGSNNFLSAIQQMRVNATVCLHRTNAMSMSSFEWGHLHTAMVEPNWRTNAISMTSFEWGHLHTAMVEPNWTFLPTS
jgi:ActR/RegA family two-component response regulator